MKQVGIYQSDGIGSFWQTDVINVHKSYTKFEYLQNEVRIEYCMTTHVQLVYNVAYLYPYYILVLISSKIKKKKSISNPKNQKCVYIFRETKKDSFCIVYKEKLGVFAFGNSSYYLKHIQTPLYSLDAMFMASMLGILYNTSIFVNFYIDDIALETSFIK